MTSLATRDFLRGEPVGHDVELLMEANAIIALTVVQFLSTEYEVVDSRKSHTSAPGQSFLDRMPLVSTTAN